MADHQKGLLITILGVLFVVPDSLFVRLIASDPLITAFWRSLTAGVMIVFFLILFRGIYSFRNLFLMGKLGWVYCFLIGSTSPAFVIAVENTSVANVVFIFASMPIFSAILSRIFLREKIPPRTIITIRGGGTICYRLWIQNFRIISLARRYVGALYFAGICLSTHNCTPSQTYFDDTCDTNRIYRFCGCREFFY